jgi:hypothetical protein
MKHAIAVFFVSVFVACFFACSTPPSDARIGVDGPPLLMFPPVADLLDHSCGTLDCHGNAQRNLVMWGCYGLRLDPTATPGCRSMGGTNSTPAEYDASYRSLVGLEPAVMTDVVENHGANPNELTFVRKAFGEEAHKGGTIFQLGSTADTCIASWLAGATNDAACASALASAP